MEGRLRITTFFESGDKFEVHDLLPESPPLYVPSGVIHQFQALSAVIAWEFSVADHGKMIDLNDIRRMSESGVSDAAID